MLHQANVRAPLAGRAETSFLAARGATVAEIESVGEALSTLRQLIGDLQRALGLVLADAGNGDPLRTIGEAVDSLAIVSRDIEQTLGNASCETACQSMLLAAKSIGRSGLEFQMIAKLTLTTVATLSVRSPELSAYADSFDDITRRLLQEANSVERRISGMLKAREVALQDFRRAVAELDRTNRLLSAEAGRGESLDGISRIRASASTLQACTRTEIGRLIGAIQFADAFAQRAEHIAIALEMADEESAIDAAALRAVATALTEDLAAGFAEMAGVVSSALASIRSSGTTARAVFSDSLQAGDLESDLRKREGQLGLAMRRALKVAPETDALAGRTRDMGELAEAAKGSLADLERISDQIFLSSINAGLISSRTSSQGGPLAVLAVATQEQASACSNLIAGCSSAISSLIKAIEALPYNQVSEQVAALTTAVERLQAGSAATYEAISALGSAAGEVSGVVDALGELEVDVQARLDRAQGALSALQAVLPPAAAVAEDGAAAHPALTTLRALYTMEREREVHDRVLGVERAVDAESNAEELDDIFF